MARGQTGFEYLLILGGTVLLASVMLVFVRGNLGSVAPEMNVSLGNINRLTAAIGESCSDCDSVFVNEGQPGSISTGMLVSGSVDSSKLADGSVGSEKIADASVGSSKIADGSIGFIDVNVAQLQRRVTGTCSIGSYITAIAADGSVTCGAVSTSWNIDGNNQSSAVSGNVGIGTTSPTKKLTVAGDISASGDVCNGAGNCLSALASLTNACGGAATTYAYSATGFSGAYCLMGASTPASPAWPAAGASTSWTCPVASGSPISCTATHSPAPVNGLCGPAATTYPYSASGFSGALCSTGAASPASPAFPAAGSSASWSCLGTNGGASPSCIASRSTPASLVNFAHTEVDCVAAGGEVVDTAVTYKQCRFNAAVCPSGWTKYLSWTTTTSTYETYPGCPSCTPYSNGARYCSGAIATEIVPIGHAWANLAPETASYWPGFVYYASGYWTQCSAGTFTAPISQVGCY